MVEAFRADDKAVSLRTKLWFGIGASGEAATNWIFTVLTFYAYSFDWGGTRVRGDTIGFLYNATHALEIPFFHGSADQQSAYLEFGIFKGFTKENYESRKLLTDAMVAYLAGFAGTGNPNGEAPLPEWKPWSNEDDGSKVIHLDADLRQLDIHQSNVEVTKENVWSDLDEEDYAARRNIMGLRMYNWQPGTTDSRGCLHPALRASAPLIH